MTSLGKGLVSTRRYTQVSNGIDQVSGCVSVPCLHASPVADVLWKPILSKRSKKIKVKSRKMS